MAFPSRHYGSFGDEKVVQTAQRGKLGRLMELPDGSLYRYGSTGEAIGAGQLAQTPLAIGNHDMDLVQQAAAAVGATSISVTLGGTAATKNQYQDGWIYINDGPGEGHRYRIKSHEAVASGGTATLLLDESLGVREALTVAATLSGLMANPYKGALLYNTTPDGIPVGFAATELASGEFGWFQTRGEACVWMQGTGVLGKVHVGGLTTTGSVDVHVSTGDAAQGVFVANSPLAVTTDYQWGRIIIE